MAKSSGKNSLNISIHKTAVVDPGAVLGAYVKVWHFSHISSGAIIRDYSKLGQNVYVAEDVSIGRNVKIQNNVSIYKGVTIEDDAFIGPSVVFTNVRNPRSEFPKGADHYTSTCIKKGATIGANATLVCGITVGRYAFVGAGSVVTRDVEDFQLVLGVPAKFSGWVCVCGDKLISQKNSPKIKCLKCHRRYLKKKPTIIKLDTN